MFIEALETDLIKVFEIKKVVFSSILGEEQDILYCEVMRSINDIKNGRQHAQVYGEVAMISPSRKLYYGWLHKQISRMPPALNAKFIFSNTEKRQAGTYGDKVLDRHSVEFTYFYDGEFNPKKAMKGVSFN
jgi:hypothetical protein